MEIEQHSAQLGFLSFPGTAVAKLRERDPELLRHGSHSFYECDVFDLLDKRKHISLHATTETIKKLPRGMDGKRGRLLVVKRAKPRIVLRSRLLQLDVVADDADDVRLLLNDFFEVAGVGHGVKTTPRRNSEGKRS